jgi:arginine-tRNA-protein transferase
MKIVFSECGIDYSQYAFAYVVHCIAEDLSEIPVVYERGFLPFTNSNSIKSEIYYLARSLRLNLIAFKLTSENKRVLNKCQPLDISTDFVSKGDFLFTDDFFQFCLTYCDKRFTNQAMNIDRLKYIVDRKSLNKIIVFKSKGKVLGYVFACAMGEMFHFWYSFFDINYLHQSIGKFMIVTTIEWARKNNYKFFYLGTCYTEKALYKVRDHRGCEFFDGNRWINDRQLLIQLCKNDKDDGTLKDGINEESSYFQSFNLDV